MKERESFRFQRPRLITAAPAILYTIPSTLYQYSSRQSFQTIFRQFPDFYGTVFKKTVLDHCLLKTTSRLIWYICL